MSIEAMKLALEALKAARRGHCDHAWADEAITALDAAIERTEKQGPVAWMDEFGNVFPLGAQRGPKYLNEPMKPLYTTPQPQQAEKQEPVAYTTGHCKEKAQPGGCQLHNLHCGYPDCDRKAVETPPAAQRKPHYDKTEMNCFVQNLYDQKMREGKRGHYETMFHVVHRAIEAAHGIGGKA